MLKQEKIDGIGPWHWPDMDDLSSDGGVWEGPKQEWPRHKELIQKYCNKMDIVLQAGGACGMYPRLLSNMFSVVYTFEPHVGNFEFLCKNAPQHNIFKFNAALGDKHEMIVMESNFANQGMHKVKHQNNAIVPVFKIDDMIYPTLDLIMLDIELYEIYALKGAIKTIKKYRPLLIIENVTKEIQDFLNELKYFKIDENKMDSYFRYHK